MMTFTGILLKLRAVLKFCRCFDNAVDDFVICRNGCIAGIFPEDE
jgi:hypothetical protein